MTQRELEKLVRQVGDEILHRLGASTALPAGRAESACACPDGAERTDGAGTGLGLDSKVPSGGGLWTAPKEGIASLIDHTLLRPEATEADILELCAQAKRYRFWSVCVHPGWVARAVRELQGSGTRVGTVVGFPHGATITPVKCTEAEQVIKLGARELDMVMNIGAIKAGDLDFVYTDVRSVVDLSHAAGAVVKVILETSLLTQEEKIKGCVVCKLAAADFVKTSTGFGPAGADPLDVALMRRLVGGEMGIKAAGGIRSYRRMQEMMAAGATRIGTSSSVGILEEAGLARAVERGR